MSDGEIVTRADEEKSVLGRGGDAFEEIRCDVASLSRMPLSVAITERKINKNRRSGNEWISQKGLGSTR